MRTIFLILRTLGIERSLQGEIGALVLEEERLYASNSDDFLK